MADARAPDAGFTLIEILVVLTLIGVSAGIVSYALPSGTSARTLDQEAALLVARLNLAAERGLMNGDHYALDWQAEGYGFQKWQDGAWRAATAAPLDEWHTLARGAILTDSDGVTRGAIAISPDLFPPVDGVAQLWLETGSMRRMVAFDGATAGVTP